MKSLIKRLAKSVVERAGYRVFATSHFGFDALADINALLHSSQVPLVIDVGACIGEFAVEVRRVMPRARVHCFEADPDTHGRLVAAVRTCPDIIPVNLALGEAPGWLDFRATACQGQSSFLPASVAGHPHVPAGATECNVIKRVQVGRLDDYAHAHGLGQIHLLKTDTQGYDLRVLRGAAQLLRERRIKAVYCEVFFKEFYIGQDYFHDIHAYLLQHGLSFAGLYGSTRDERNGELLWADALYVNPSLS